MINRQYFMSAVRHKNDGSGGFGYNYLMFTYKSWKADPVAAFKHGLDQICKDAGWKEDEHIQVITFNRI